MALASEDEWESDPELKAMRRDFLDSFVGRREALEAVVPVLANASGDPVAYEGALKAALHVAHKLAGAAETYGFPTLTRACSGFEDWFHLVLPEKRRPGDAAQYSSLIAELLEKTRIAGKDVPAGASDPRFVELEAAAKAAKAAAGR
jgi:HPt (histidine-containing phosphotransfer) domain-containing protein